MEYDPTLPDPATKASTDETDKRCATQLHYILTMLFPRSRGEAEQRGGQGERQRGLEFFLL